MSSPSPEPLAPESPPPECTVHLHGHLWRLAGWEQPASRRLALTPGQTVADLLASLRVPPNDVFGVLVGGRRARPDAALRPGDEVEVLPAICGG